MVSISTVPMLTLSSDFFTLKFKIAAEKHHNHIESEIVYMQTQ